MRKKLSAFVKHERSAERNRKSFCANDSRRTAHTKHKLLAFTCVLLSRCGEPGLSSKKEGKRIGRECRRTHCSPRKRRTPKEAHGFSAPSPQSRLRPNPPFSALSSSHGIPQYWPPKAGAGAGAGAAPAPVRAREKEHTLPKRTPSQKKKLS